jgi:hypothetical protein
MPTLKLSLDQETMDALDERAKLELRYADQQAVALLRQSLGLPVPYKPAKGQEGGGSASGQS